MKSDDPLGTQSRRLRAVRKLYADKGGKAATERFAAEMDFSYNRWNNFENGYEFPRAAAFAFHDKYPDISIDWIWWGITRGMTESLLQQLRAAAEKEDNQK